jgi:hypothetical protein
MSYYEQLEKFKGQVRVAMVGTADDRKMYEKVTGRVGGVPLLGPYGIRSDEWAVFTSEAGIEGARWQDKGAQEAVINHQLTKLYNRYDGRWDGVAVAWQAGEAAADRIVTDNEPIATVIKGEGASALQGWVDDVIGPLENVAPGPEDFSDAATYNGPFANATLVSRGQPTVTKQRDPGDVIAARLTQMKRTQMSSIEEQVDSTEEQVDSTGEVSIDG